MATVAGASSFIPGRLTPIWEQSGSILGWTCGNLAASPVDVATFYRDLLVEGALLRPSSLAAMQQLHLLDYNPNPGPSPSPSPNPNLALTLTLTGASLTKRMCAYAARRAGGMASSSKESRRQSPSAWWRPR